MDTISILKKSLFGSVLFVTVFVFSPSDGYTEEGLIARGRGGGEMRGGGVHRGGVHRGPEEGFHRGPEERRPVEAPYYGEGVPVYTEPSESDEDDQSESQQDQEAEKQQEQLRRDFPDQN